MQSQVADSQKKLSGKQNKLQSSINSQEPLLTQRDVCLQEKQTLSSPLLLDMSKDAPSVKDLGSPLDSDPTFCCLCIFDSPSFIARATSSPGPPHKQKRGLMINQMEEKEMQELDGT
uniref:Uncharacterized protein n=1 Tax=Sphaerodactylus townsendi TaxID=933632 RepID=A0ACB8ES12_9SAUR